MKHYGLREGSASVSQLCIPFFPDPPHCPTGSVSERCVLLESGVSPQHYGLGVKEAPCPCVLRFVPDAVTD